MKELRHGMRGRKESGIPKLLACLLNGRKKKTLTSSMKLAVSLYSKDFDISKLPLQISLQEMRDTLLSRRRGMAVVLSLPSRPLNSETKRFTSPNALNHYRLDGLGRFQKDVSQVPLQ
jgi:hypothetical protein